MYNSKKYRQISFYSNTKKINNFDKILIYLMCFGIRLSGLITIIIKFRLYYRLSKIISYFIPSYILCKIIINKDTNYNFFLNDPYYNRLIYSGYKYEPEIEILLTKIKKIKYVFFDVGANYGYWSLIASSKYFGYKKTIAIEPVHKNFVICKRNCKSNKSRFQLIKKGVSNFNGTKYIYVDNLSRSAVASSLVKPRNILFKKELINIISMDKILTKYKKFNYHVVKLDVEGEEINCFKSIRKNFVKKILFIYEDHGNDVKNRNTKYLIKKGYKIFMYFGNKTIQIKKHTDLNIYKNQKTVGYNLFATKSKKFLKYLING